MTLNPFHLAFPVNDLEKTERFYVDVLDCAIGRRSEHWIDINFRGHQITGHLAPEECAAAERNPVDGKLVPVRHFGIVLDWLDWENLSQRLSQQGLSFYLEPQIRFAGKVGEQGTFFLADPSGNMLEFKSFRNPDRLFASDVSQQR